MMSFVNESNWYLNLIQGYHTILLSKKEEKRGEKRRLSLILRGDFKKMRGKKEEKIGDFLEEI